MEPSFRTLLISIIALTTSILPSFHTHPTIQIHDITNNAGALILQRGEGRIIDGHDRLLHVIDFAQFEISLTIIENIVNKIKNTPTDFSEIIQLKLKEIKFIFDTLISKPSRDRRAIDFLGSTIKFITGNLDSEDLKIINSNLDELRKNGNVLVKQNNKQIKINSKFENRLNLINNQIREHQNILNKIAEQENVLISENQKFILVLQLDSFLENLKSIEYAVMLAKVNIINNLILTPRELETIIQEISKQGLEIKHVDEASSYLTTTVLRRRSSLIICVNIPRLTQTIYRRTTIEPLPRLNHTVQIHNKEVFINSERIFAIASPCRENNKVTICERKQLIEISNNPCEAPLLKGQQGQCKMIEKPPATETRMIGPGTLLVIAVHQDVVINGTCVNTRTLTGIHLTAAGNNEIPLQSWINNYQHHQHVSTFSFRNHKISAHSEDKELLETTNT
ncbi:uncharacterized protein LOC129719527 [Wyeomyia smithii]|uniref:uncharacterized protein LOC129719527 n=1 Tax=Wyeomyia smithii TaxID=174621 RepID=UPI0024681907|nr:uncharacterized protein LOC129719527 [Wyeomyia smithii]